MAGVLRIPRENLTPYLLLLLPVMCLYVDLKQYCWTPNPSSESLCYFCKNWFCIPIFFKVCCHSKCCLCFRLGCFGLLSHFICFCQLPFLNGSMQKSRSYVSEGSKINTKAKGLLFSDISLYCLKLEIIFKNKSWHPREYFLSQESFLLCKCLVHSFVFTFLIQESMCEMWKDQFGQFCEFGVTPRNVKVKEEIIVWWLQFSCFPCVFENSEDFCKHSAGCHI